MVSNTMKIVITCHGEEEYAYTPETIVNDVRTFAAEKLKCKATELDVRKRGQGVHIACTKTFQDVGITEKDTLVVGKTVKNYMKIAAHRVISGKGKASTKHDITQVMTQANKKHNEVIGHVEANREQLETMNNNMLELMSRKKGNLSEQDVKNIPKLSDQDLIAKKMSVNKISGVCSHKVITISLKNKFAKRSV